MLRSPSNFDGFNKPLVSRTFIKPKLKNWIKRANGSGKRVQTDTSKSREQKAGGTIGTKEAFLRKNTRFTKKRPIDRTSFTINNQGSKVEVIEYKSKVIKKEGMDSNRSPSKRNLSRASDKKTPKALRKKASRIHKCRSTENLVSAKFDHQGVKRYSFRHGQAEEPNPRISSFLNFKISNSLDKDLFQRQGMVSKLKLNNTVNKCKTSRSKSKNNRCKPNKRSDKSSSKSFVKLRYKKTKYLKHYSIKSKNIAIGKEQRDKIIDYLKSQNGVDKQKSYFLQTSSRKVKKNGSFLQNIKEVTLSNSNNALNSTTRKQGSIEAIQKKLTIMNLSKNKLFLKLKVQNASKDMQKTPQILQNKIKNSVMATSPQQKPVRSRIKTISGLQQLNDPMPKALTPSTPISSTKQHLAAFLLSQKHEWDDFVSKTAPGKSAHPVNERFIARYKRMLDSANIGLAILSECGEHLSPRSVETSRDTIKYNKYTERWPEARVKHHNTSSSSISNIMQNISVQVSEMKKRVGDIAVFNILEIKGRVKGVKGIWAGLGKGARESFAKPSVFLAKTARIVQRTPRKKSIDEALVDEYTQYVLEILASELVEDNIIQKILSINSYMAIPTDDKLTEYISVLFIFLKEDEETIEAAYNNIRTPHDIPNTVKLMRASCIDDELDFGMSYPDPPQIIPQIFFDHVEDRYAQTLYKENNLNNSEIAMLKSLHQLINDNINSLLSKYRSPSLSGYPFLSGHLRRAYFSSLESFISFLECELPGYLCSQVGGSGPVAHAPFRATATSAPSLPDSIAEVGVQISDGVFLDIVEGLITDLQKRFN